MVELARLFVIFGGLIVLALTMALVGPYFVDWTSYRAEFEREASAVLGRKVTVEGAAKARLLPFPSLSFADVQVAGTNAGDPAMTVESFSMDAELAPFLSGEVLIFDMRLVKPKATITIDENGTVDWAVRPSTPFDPQRISLERLTIEGGEISLRHAAGGRSHLISGIDAIISARSLAGPWRMDGSLAVDGVATTVAVSTGELEEGGMRLRIQADPAAYPFTIETDGNARMVNGAAIYGGRFGLAARDEAELRGSNGETFAVNEGADAPPQYRVAGEFSIDHRLIGIDEFRLETGPLENPYTAEGTAFIDLGPEPRFEIKADGAQVQFDEAVEEGNNGGGLTFAQRTEALRRLVAGLPDPEMPGTVEVNLPAIVAGDTTIRSVRLSAEPADDGWKVNSLAATLPGRTTLEADGFLTAGDDFGFSGSLLLAVAQPSGFAAWLSKDVDDSIRRLPAAGFSAKVDIGERQQRFRDLELVLGAAKFAGEIDNLQPEGGRGSMMLRLRGGELDVDGLAAFASLFVSDGGVNRFDDHDLDFEIAAGPVHAGGISAETLDMALRLKEGLLEIDRLSIGNLAGASISATGTIKDFPESPSGNLDASLVAVDLEPLVRLVAKRYPQNGIAAALRRRADGFSGFFQDATLDLVASAAANGDGATGLAVSAHGTSAGTGFTVTASAEGSPDLIGGASLNLDFSAQNEDASALMALYGLPALPLGMTGPGDTSLSMRGTVGKGLQAAFAFGGEDLQATFEGVITGYGEDLSAQGGARFTTGDLEPWLMTAGLALPGLGLGLPVSLQGELAYGGGAIRLSSLNGSVVEAAIAGDLRAELNTGVPHVSGALTLDALDLGVAAALVLGEAPLQGERGSLPETPFNASPLLAFTADLDLTAKAVSTGAVFDASDAKMKLRLDADGLRVADLEAAAHGGKMAGLFELRNNGGTGLFSSQLRLDGAELQSVFADSRIAGTGDLAASLTASGKSLSGMVASLSGSGTAAVRDLVIAGVNPQAFQPILAQADQIGRDIDAAKTADFAPRIAGEGAFRTASAELAFTVAGGVLRAPPLTLESEGATMTADIRADLAAATVQVTGQIAYQAGEDALVGSNPVVGFAVEGPIGAARLSFDTEPLAQFLTQRALEREQARVEAMQASLLEQQRLRRETRYFAELQETRERIEIMRLQMEQEERRRADAQARLRAQEEALAEAEAEALQIEEETRLRAEEEARAAEEEALQQAEEDVAREAEAAPPVQEPVEPRRETSPILAEPEIQPQAETDADGLPGVTDPFKSLSIEGLLNPLE